MAQVLHRLNEWTVDETQFYAVKVEVTRGGRDSELEPRLRKVVYPGGWDKGETLSPKPPPPPDVQRLQSFFDPLITDMERTRQFQRKPHIRFDHAGRYFHSSKNKGLSYAVAFEKTNSAWVILHIEADDKESTKRTFDALKSRRSEIESEIPIDSESEWVWRRHDKRGLLQHQREEGRLNHRPAGGTTQDPDVDARPLEEVPGGVRSTDSGDPQRGHLAHGCWRDDGMRMNTVPLAT